jgi:hypothetical protein
MFVRIEPLGAKAKQRLAAFIFEAEARCAEMNRTFLLFGAALALLLIANALFGPAHLPRPAASPSQATASNALRSPAQNP